MKNKILNIGSITKDIIISDSGTYKQIGGAVYYILCTLNQLKVPVTSIIMIGKDDVEILDNLDDKDNIQIIKNQKSMEYTNIYQGMTRLQKAQFPKEELRISQIKNIDLKNYKTALISPLSPYEIKLPLLQYLKENQIETVLLLQGFIRHTDSDNNVYTKSWNNYSDYLRYADIISSDEEEFKTAFNIKNLTDEPVLDILTQNDLKLIIITKAHKGSILYTKDEIINIPVIKTEREVDHTGLGDTYISAFISKKDEYGYKKAGLFAALVAKEKLEHKGGLKTSKKEIMKKFNDILN